MKSTVYKGKEKKMSRS